MTFYYTYYSYEEWGRGYIGRRSCQCLPEKDTCYFGSYHDKTFYPTEKIILGIYASYEESIDAEIILHDFYQVDVNPHFVNKAKQKSNGFSYSVCGKDNPFFGRGHFGKDNPMSNPKVRERHRLAVTSPEHKKMMSEKFSGEDNPFFGKTHSTETKQLLSELASQRTGKSSPRWGKKHKQVVCEHCQKQITYPMYKRWHGPRCKNYQESSD